VRIFGRLVAITVEQQWNRLSTVSWQNTDDSDLGRLWVDVVNHTDATGELDFSVVGKFALSVLALPFSNAAVERTFSQMNLIKSKRRSKMHQELLESILYVRGFMSINGLCCNHCGCNSFQPTADMFARFTTDICIYQLPVANKNLNRKRLTSEPAGCYLVISLT